MTKTKRQLEADIEALHIKLELMTKEALMMREIVSIQKCLKEARELLAEVGGSEADARLLAAFISRVWWIDLQPEQLQSHCPAAGDRVQNR
jgi:hypothetical protein